MLKKRVVKYGRAWVPAEHRLTRNSLVISSLATSNKAVRKIVVQGRPFPSEMKERREGCFSCTYGSILFFKEQQLLTKAETEKGRVSYFILVIIKVLKRVDVKNLRNNILYITIIKRSIF